MPWLIITIPSEKRVNFLCQIISNIRGGISEAKPDQNLNLKTG